MSAPVQTDGVARLLRRAGRRLPRVVRGVSTVSAVALALITAQVLFRAWATSRSWFMWDDYIFLADVTRGDADVAWLFRSHYNLVQPLGFVLVWSLGWAGFDWSIVATQMIVLQLLASLACWWMLRVVFGSRRLILLPLTFYLFSPFTVPATVWWSVAIYQYPHHIAIFGAIAMHVQYCRTGRWQHLLGSSAFVTLGLASYIKAPLLPAVLLLISVLWFTSGSARERTSGILRQWPAWGVYAALTVGYVWFWSTRQLGGAPRDRCELPGVIDVSVLETIGTGLVGGPWGWRLWTGGIDPFIAASDCVPLSYRGNPDLVVGGAPQSLTEPALTGIVAAWLLILALSVYAAARHRHALRAAPLVLVYIAVSVTLVYAGRAGTFGSQVSAREIRYVADLAAVGAFAIGTALMPITGATVRLARRDEPLLTWQMPRAGVIGLTIAFVAGSVFSTLAYVRPWHATVDAESFPERVFLERVQDELDRRSGVVEIADVPLPVVVANPVIAPYNLPSRKLAPMQPDLVAVEQGTDLSVLGADGTIRSATIPDGPRADPGPVEDCGYLVQQSSERIDITPVVPGPWWTRIDYLASEDGELIVRAGRTIRRIEVERGLHQLLMRTDGDFDSVSLRAEGTVTVCVDNVHVGPVLPQLPVGAEAVEP